MIQVTCKSRKAHTVSTPLQLSELMAGRHPPLSSSATIDVHTVNTS